VALILAAGAYYAYSKYYSTVPIDPGETQRSYPASTDNEPAQVVVDNGVSPSTVPAVVTHTATSSTVGSPTQVSVPVAPATTTSTSSVVPASVDGVSQSEKEQIIAGFMTLKETFQSADAAKIRSYMISRAGNSPEAKQQSQDFSDDDFLTAAELWLAFNSDIGAEQMLAPSTEWTITGDTGSVRIQFDDQTATLKPFKVNGAWYFK
jgi:hypothetical protein